MTPLTKMLLAASFVAGNPVQGPTEINYWLWDSNQQPSYQACADAFEKENPEWANFAASMGWNYSETPWATHFNYDDPKLVATIRWFAELSLRKGFIVPAKDARQAQATGLFAAQKGALALTGSWLVHWFTENCKFPIGFAPLPQGPVGRRSVINGLADSIFLNGEDPGPKLEASNREINALFR